MRHRVEILRGDRRKDADLRAAMARQPRLRIARARVHRDVVAPRGEARRQLLGERLEAAVARGNPAGSQDRQPHGGRSYQLSGLCNLRPHRAHGAVGAALGPPASRCRSTSVSTPRRIRQRRAGQAPPLRHRRDAVRAAAGFAPCADLLLDLPPLGPEASPVSPEPGEGGKRRPFDRQAGAEDDEVPRERRQKRLREVRRASGC